MSPGHVECVRGDGRAPGQCRKVPREGGWPTLVRDDTAGAGWAAPQQRVNLTKIESYRLAACLPPSCFYVEIEGQLEAPASHWPCWECASSPPRSASRTSTRYAVTD